MKKYRFHFFVLLTACLIFPRTAHAHRLCAMIQEGLFVFAVAAFVAAFVKAFIAGSAGGIETSQQITHPVGFIVTAERIDSPYSL
jgi:hypothetical protein